MSSLEKITYYLRAYYEMKVARNTLLSVLPEYVAIEITNVCNFKCAFCPQSDPKHHEIVPKTYLDRKTCELFLGKIRKAGIKTNLMHWTLDGEPFMNKDFAKLCSLGVKYGFTNTYFATNGMLCTADRIREFPVDRLRLNLAIDFCADKHYFEEVRGTKNSWEQVKNNIIAISKSADLHKVRIDITDISSFSEDDPDVLRTNFTNLKALFSGCDRISFRTRTFHNATGFLPENESKRTGRYHLCPYPWTTLRIASNGDVVACCRDLQHKTVLGNLKFQDVTEIWNGNPMQELRRNLLDEKPELSAACAGCDLPYDDSKFTLRNMFQAAKGRMQIFAS